jgi:hypothetical protein
MHVISSLDLATFAGMRGNLIGDKVSPDFAKRVKQTKWICERSKRTFSACKSSLSLIVLT